MVELGRVPYSGLTGRLSWEDRLAVDAALERMGLSGFADRPVTELSGGERQRVVLARAIAQDAQGLLLDEPMTGLDYGYQLRLMALLADLAREGRLVMLTSHRPEELYVRASRVLVLDHGRIDADGPPQDVVTAQRMSALYGVPLTQTDHAGNRFSIMEGREMTLSQLLKRFSALTLPAALLGGALAISLPAPVAHAAPPERIVEGWYAHNATLIMLGAQDRIVGTVARPAMLPWMFRLVPELAKAETLDPGNLNAEELLALHPDLVFVTNSGHSAEALTRAG